MIIVIFQKVLQTIVSSIFEAIFIEIINSIKTIIVIKIDQVSFEYQNSENQNTRINHLNEE